MSKLRTEMCNYCAFDKFNVFPCVKCREYDSGIRSNFRFKNSSQKYWTDYKNNKKKLKDLDDDHVCNIVYMFGWSNLLDSGYQLLVDRFIDILKKRGLETP